MLYLLETNFNQLNSERHCLDKHTIMRFVMESALNLAAALFK
jgi:hypothetical protein